MLRPATLSERNIYVVLKCVLCCFMILFLSVECRSQTFGFSASDVIIMKGSDAYKTGDKGVFVIEKDGSQWIAQLSQGGDPGPVTHLESLKVMNGKRGKYVYGTSSDIKFEINTRQLTFITSSHVVAFPQESLGSDFQQQLTALMSKLGASPSSRPGSAKTGARKNPLLPTSGNLTATTFAAHPYGFLPQGPMSLAEASGYLRQAGWPSKPYENSLISIVSCTAFKIPFTMYGKDVTTMSMSWYEGKNTSYDLCIADYTDNWTKEDAMALAEKIYDELIANGYQPTEVTLSYKGHYSEKAVTNGKVYVQINSSAHSIRESWDSYGVEIDVRYR